MRHEAEERESKNPEPLAGSSDLTKPEERLIQALWRRWREALDSGLPEDLRQEACLALVHSADAVRSLPESRRVAYRKTCVRRALLHWIKTEQAEREHTLSIDSLRDEEAHFLELPDPGSTEGLTAAPHNLEESISAPLLLAALRSLPAHDRGILDLAYFLRLTDAEIGQWLGIPVASAKKRRQRAILKLQHLLQTSWGGQVSAAT